MVSKSHRRFCESIVPGLTGALADPRCSLNTARFNDSRLRPKSHIQEKVAHLHAQVDAITVPAMLTLVEKRRCLARVVRANLDLLNPEIDGDLLVSLQVEAGRKQRRVKEIHIQCCAWSTQAKRRHPRNKNHARVLELLSDCGCHCAGRWRDDLLNSLGSQNSDLVD